MVPSMVLGGRLIPEEWGAKGTHKRCQGKEQQEHGSQRTWSEEKRSWLMGLVL